MPRLILFLLVCAWAALAPLLRSEAAGPAAESNAGSAPDGQSKAWPSHWEGRPLRPLPLTASERRFAGEFPWAMARFTDGSREFLFRRVDRATRALHPAPDCLKAAGYSTRPLPAWSDAAGRTWSRTEARRKGETLEVRELICGEDGACRPDISSWYWHAVWGRGRGPWMAVTASRRL